MKIFYDLHIHSCLSPCGSEDMTPNNIVNMAKIMGYDIIALTDHNTCGNCEATMAVGKSAGLTVIPGMELCTAEEVHIVCLFPNIKSADAFSKYVYSTIPPIKNKPHIFGEQIYMNKVDEVTGIEEKLLITASSVSINSVAKLVGEYNGVCFPAHIDRHSFSIISNLGTINESFGFTTAEIHDNSQKETLENQFHYLKKAKIVYNSDAHYLEKMRLPDKNFAELNECSVEAMLEYLKQ